MKKRVTVFIALCLAASLTACGAAPDGQGENNNGEEMTAMSVELKEENFKELGRTYYNEGKIYCALSGTGVEFTFTGTACSVTVTGDDSSANPAAKDIQPRIAIYVNGGRVIDDMIDRREKTYRVFESDTEQNVAVRIIKLSESPHSTFAISDISVTGRDVAPTADKEPFIEFIGDSITCGYGVDDEVAEHSFSTATEDVTKAYAYKTAELLDADYSMVSFSGYGIISGYTGDGNKIPSQTVPQYYAKLGYSWTGGGFAPSEISWDFGRRQPDIIVINLGTNDDSYCKNIEERCLEYQREYVNFLKTVREHNPNALIIGALGIMGQNLCPYAEAAIAQYSGETGDKNVSYLTLDEQRPEDGFAANWHPTETTHEKAAGRLAEKIREALAE